MHLSIPVENSCEFINIVPVNPLISKCQIKVCYVGEDPNRNGSIITKEVAASMANSLPGCPIVGFYSDKTDDFEEHNRQIDISNGVLTIKDTTIPYGFVDLNAKVWFQKFVDDGEVEREYLVTEGYIWTGQYPEARRIIEKGNNQSMELDEKTLDGTWTKNSNDGPQFFIINEAIISKLCILGEDVEPCFEGAQIKATFALDESFTARFSQMAEELKEILGKGGKHKMEKYAVNIGDALWTAVSEKYPNTEYKIKGFYEEEGQKFALLCHREDNVLNRLDFSLDEENAVSLAENLIDYTADEIEDQFSDEEVEAFYTPKQTYVLDEIPEYTELLEQFNDLTDKYNLLTNDYNAVQTKCGELETQLNALNEYKLSQERKAKEDMIASFTMLSDAEKADCAENIDKYSLDEIESKLSVICVRNKLNLSAGQDPQGEGAAITYSLNQQINKEPEAAEVPAWVKAVQETEKSL